MIEVNLIPDVKREYLHAQRVRNTVISVFVIYIRKLIPCFMLGAFMIKTTKVNTFLAAISRLHLPKGFTISLSITLRYFFTMTEE